jgi:hypothetical protein
MTPDHTVDTQIDACLARLPHWEPPPDFARRLVAEFERQQSLAPSRRSDPSSIDVMRWWYVGCGVAAYCVAVTLVFPIDRAANYCLALALILGLWQGVELFASLPLRKPSQAKRLSP